MSKFVYVVFGTRPEAIKMAPVIAAFRERPEFRVRVISTGQHREMLQPILSWFEIKVDLDLELMEANQSLAELSAKALVGLDALFRQNRPDLVLVQGDTTSALAAAQAAFYQRVPVGHVEAGLRTYNPHSPWPEEVNRNLISKLATYHFAPTAANQANLLREQIPPESIFVTGNTVIDALLYSSAMVSARNIYPQSLSDFFCGSLSGARVVLVTGHRRENFGVGFESICRAIGRLAQKHPEVHFVYPVHLNPSVQGTVRTMLKGIANVHLVEPLGYPEFIAVMMRCYFILSDSGGVQEEAPSFRKPLLLMRDTTERPEGVDAGAVCLVGTDEDVIFREADGLLCNPENYQRMVAKHNPFGDGTAARRIVDVLFKSIFQ